MWGIMVLDRAAPLRYSRASLPHNPSLWVVLVQFRGPIQSSTIQVPLDGSPSDTPKLEPRSRSKKKFIKGIGLTLSPPVHPKLFRVKP
jgi:hypothetical protein